MGKLILKMVSISLLFISMALSAQEFQGKATYQTKRKVDMKLDDSEMSDVQKQQIQEMLKKQFEKTFVLTFNKDESIYKEEEKLENPTSSPKGGMMVMSFGGGAGATYYKNTKAKTFADQQDLFGKQFLIKDSLEELEWKLEEDSKVIGKYLCFKATAIREVSRMEMNFDTDADDSDNKEPEEITENQLIVVWYTTDIPVSNGPAEYGGLPGLILELNADETQYVCTKIVMNTKDKVSEPTKGKVVDQEQFRKIMEKKMEEMKEQYGGRERKGEGGRKFSISISG